MKERTLIRIYVAMVAVLAVYTWFNFSYNKPVKKSESAPNNLSAIVRLTTSTGRTFCSGTVISDKLIITAGHCVVEENLLGQAALRGEVGIRTDENVELGVKAHPFYATSQLDQGLMRGDF